MLIIIKICSYIIQIINREIVVEKNLRISNRLIKNKKYNDKK